MHVFFHSLILIILVSSAYSFASYNLLADKLNILLKDLPTVQIKNAKAVWPQDLKLPYIKKFPPKGPRKIYYILDSGKNKAALEEKYEMYALFTDQSLVLNDGYDRSEFDYKKLESNPSMNSFFGEPLKFSPFSLSQFMAFCITFTLGLFLGLFLLILFPVFNLFVALIVNIAGKWNLTLPELTKLSFFSATPACLIQIIGCLFLILNWQILFIGLIISVTIQIAYLITGLKAYKESF